MAKKSIPKVRAKSAAVRPCAGMNAISPEPVYKHTQLSYCRSLFECVEIALNGSHPQWPKSISVESLCRVRGHISTILSEIEKAQSAGVLRASHLRLVVDNTA
jgi:hypothetical protein